MTYEINMDATPTMQSVLDLTMLGAGFLNAVVMARDDAPSLCMCETGEHSDFDPQCPECVERYAHIDAGYNW